jgi:surface antigen
MKLPRILASSGAFLVAVTVCRWSTAANICNETVASNRMVDGIPAYDQCTDSTSSAIYSDDGVDTGTTSGGTGWVRTQGSGGYQCTELAHRYLYFKWKVQSVPNGNAGTWCDGAVPTGLVKATTPVHGDLIVFAPGSCGADSTTGHVAVVDVVNADSTVTFVEQNRAGRRKCANTTAACFLHATANSGTSVDAGTPTDATADAMGGGADGAAAPDVLRRADGMAGPDRAPTVGTGGASGRGGTGGTTGAGGVVGSGGAAALAGSSGAGGGVGSGGTLSSTPATTRYDGSGGSATPASTTSPAASSDGSSGCACRLTNARRSDSTGWPLAMSLVAIVIARRRSAGANRAGRTAATVASSR